MPLQPITNLATYMRQPYFDRIFEDIYFDFINHFLWTGNDRIIFSGKFGTGKSTFLEWFFDIKKQRELFPKPEHRFTAYRLSPVHYSISRNEDIIQYIKYDILLEFLQRGDTFETADLHFLTTLPAFIRQNPTKIIGTILTMVPKVGKDIAEMFDKLVQLKDSFKQFQSQMNRSDDKELTAYLAQIEQKEGSLYSDDVITKLIGKHVSQKTHPVLIIDDLDRLDPEHTFRVLNVFSAHLHKGTNYSAANTFGFEKIILVCDYDNLRHLFFHRYGGRADFDGYMDKFISHEVFQVDSRVSTDDLFKSLLPNIIFKFEPDGQVVPRETIMLNDFVQRFVSCFVDMRIINLRGVVKQFEREIDTIPETILIGKYPSNTPAALLPIAIQLNILGHFFSDVEAFLQAIDKCRQLSIWPGYAIDSIGQFIVLLTFQSHEFLQIDCKEYLVDYGEQHFVLTPTRSGDSAIIAVKTELINKTQDLRTPFDCTAAFFWSTMKEAVLQLQDIEFIE